MTVQPPDSASITATRIMNGPVEEGAKAVGGIVEALKAQPLSLALVIMNIGLLGFLYYGGVQAHKERQEETKLMYEYRAQIAKLLYQCAPFQRPSD